MRTLIILLSIIITSDISFPQEQYDEVLTIDKSISIALENNLNIKISDNDVDVMKARVKKTKSAYYPQIKFRFIVPFIGRESGIFLDQLIWDFGYTPNLVKASKAEFNSFIQQKNIVINEVILNTKINYYKLLISKNYLETAEQKIKEFSEKVEQINNFVKLGIKSKLDLTRARVALAQTKLEKINYNKQFEITKEEFLNTIGLKTDFNYKLQDDLTFNEYNADINEVIKTAIANRPELKSLQNKENSKRAELNASRQDHLPKLLARTAYRFDGDGATGPDYIAGIGLDLPIFEGFYKVASVEESAASLRRIQNEIELAKRNIILEIKKLYFDLTYARQKMDVTSEALSSTNENLELTKELYNLGRISEIELIEAESIYSKSRSEYLESVYNYKIAKAKLQWATGDELISVLIDNS